MSRPKKDMVKITEQGVVTEEALIAYLQDKLSAEEKQQLEKLLLDDPFAQDALEGLKSSLNQVAVTTSISSLKKKVRERSGLKERKKLQIHWVSYAWAAVVFGLLIGIGFIMVNFLNKKDSNLALNEKQVSTNTPSLLPADTASVSKKPEMMVVDSSVRGKAVSDSVAAPTLAAAAQNKQGNLNMPATGSAASVKANTGAVTANGATQTYNYSAQTITGAASQKPAPIDAQQTKNVLSKQKVATDSIHVSPSNGMFQYSTTTTTATKAPVAISASPSLFKKEVSKDPAALQDEAMNSFNSGDYNTAADDFDKILKHDPDNADALYFGGISDYINGKIVKSENNFDKLLKKGNKYVDGSKWYKANILIKKGHSAEAKPLLQDLSNSNGSYKERAIKKLAEMGF